MIQGGVSLDVGGEDYEFSVGGPGAYEWRGMMLNIVESRSELFSDLYMYRSPGAYEWRGMMLNIVESRSE